MLIRHLVLMLWRLTFLAFGAHQEEFGVQHGITENRPRCPWLCLNWNQMSHVILHRCLSNLFLTFINSILPVILGKLLQCPTIFYKREILFLMFSVEMFCYEAGVCMALNVCSVYVVFVFCFLFPPLPAPPPFLETPESLLTWNLVYWWDVWCCLLKALLDEGFYLVCSVHMLIWLPGDLFFHCYLSFRFLSST